MNTMQEMEFAGIVGRKLKVIPMSNICDKKTLFGRCNRPAFIEVYWKTVCKDGMKAVSLRHWSYLCKKHYYIDRIKNWLFRWQNWYCNLDDRWDE